MTETMRDPASYIILLFSVMLTMMFSCRNESTEEKKIDPRNYKEPLMEANRHVVKTENQHIEDLLRRYRWDMEESGSGLRYMIYEQGSGEAAEKGALATINYTVRVITGDVVYSSEQDGPLSFVIGKGEVISGLEEGILLLNVGDKAKFVIPSHLAYGLVGDGKMIPGKATLIYDVELTEIKRSN
jgi:FKBP-type peptidyl-prolyl cis-trans isomerase